MASSKKINFEQLLSWNVYTNVEVDDVDICLVEIGALVRIIYLRLVDIVFSKAKEVYEEKMDHSYKYELNRQYNSYYNDGCVDEWEALWFPAGVAGVIHMITFDYLRAFTKLVFEELGAPLPRDLADMLDSVLTDPADENELKGFDRMLPRNLFDALYKCYYEMHPSEDPQLWTG